MPGLDAVDGGVGEHQRVAGLDRARDRAGPERRRGLADDLAEALVLHQELREGGEVFGAGAVAGIVEPDRGRVAGVVEAELGGGGVHLGDEGGNRAGNVLGERVGGVVGARQHHRRHQVANRHPLALLESEHGFARAAASSRGRSGSCRAGTASGSGRRSSASSCSRSGPSRSRRCRRARCRRGRRSGSRPGPAAWAASAAPCPACPSPGHARSERRSGSRRLDQQPGEQQHRAEYGYGGGEPPSGTRYVRHLAARR